MSGTPPPDYRLGLRLQGRRAVVAGGGHQATRQVADLLDAGADVLVVAPVLSPSLEEAAHRGDIAVRRRAFAGSDLDGAWLAFACTGQPQADSAVADEAERRRIWCGRDDAAATLSRQPTAGPEPAASGADRVLVLGGARSGKSVTAERLLAGHARVDYIATGPARGAGDQEWDARVLAHQQRRPAGWRTAETLDVERELAAPRESVPVLVDCLSTWLAGVLDDCGVWAGRPEADSVLTERLDSLVQAWRQTRRRVVAVSNEVGSGVVPGTVSGRRFRDELGRLNARIAAQSQEVWLCTAGIARRLR
jgi:adenosylcobinamide kinase/adenosylcobinamide-phosphate guanylyltransferase